MAPGQKMNVQCDFNDAYICGYTSSVTGAVQWTQATSIVADGAAVNPNITVIGTCAPKPKHDNDLTDMQTH